MTPGHPRHGRFDFERHVPMALVFGFLLQTAGALFWAGSAAQRLAELERDRAAQASAIERVVRLEVETMALHETLARIETKLDRMTGPRAEARN